MMTVVGSGVIDVSTACHLSGAGHPVAIVEQAGGPAEMRSFARAGFVAAGDGEADRSPALARMISSPKMAGAW